MNARAHDTQRAARPRRALLPAMARAMRPAQWTKNAVVLAAFFFALWDRHQALGVSAILTVIPAAVLFCIVSSGIYVLNDIQDREADRQHPAKRQRPVAAGDLPVPAAWALAIGLIAAGALGAALLSPPFVLVVTLYAVMQILYTALLKRIALVDVFVIAAGFVLRAIAGAVVLGIVISPWLLLCAFLLALFLALCKRRHEKRLADELGSGHRANLDNYDERLLDLLISMMGGCTIVSYALYTLSRDTVEKFGTHALGFTVPFVAFGIFRYMDLAYRKNRGDRPERVLLTDIPILLNLVLYGLTVIAVFVLRG